MKYGRTWRLVSRMPRNSKTSFRSQTTPCVCNCGEHCESVQLYEFFAALE